MPDTRGGFFRTSLTERVRLEATRFDLALITIVFLAFALRLAYFTGLHFADDPDYAMRAFDLLRGRAHLYLDNNGLRIGTWYPAALGYWLFGVNDFGLVAYPFVMSVLAIVVVARLGARLFDRRTGLVAALLLACYPLDVELATRLLPDALLSAWSVIAVSYLFQADLAQEEMPGATQLARPWSYVASGAVIGWCTAVNMSAVVLIVFVAAYFPISSAWLCRGLGAKSAVRRFVRVCVRRYALVLVGFLLVTAAEASLYRWQFGSFLAKYSATVGHYTSPDVSFYRDLWFYPENMLFLHRGWRFQLPPWEYRPYGFFFVAALPCVAYGLIRRHRHFWMVALWLCATFAYLQWGTMSATSWNLLHRLDRHLELVTPPLVLVIAAAMVSLARRPLGAVVATAAVTALGLSSARTIHARHAEAMTHLAVMKPIHSILEVYRPSDVFMDTQTAAYQRFLDRYREQRWAYHDVELISRDVTEDSIAIIHSDNDFQGLPRGSHSTPGDWQLLTTMDVSDNREGRKTIRAFRVAPPRLPPLDLTRSNDVEEHLRQIAAARMTGGTRVLFAWSGVVDGLERVDIRGETAMVTHRAFLPAREVVWKAYRPLPITKRWHYELIPEAGRGSVRLLDTPMPDNNFLLSVEVDDSAPPGAAPYRWFVVARPVE